MRFETQNWRLVKISVPLVGLLMACTPSTPKDPTSPTTQVKSETFLYPETIEEAQDDLVGNWVLDLTKSKAVGLEDSIKKKSKFSLIIDPAGERILYRDGQVIETGQLTINAVQKDGRILGSFQRTPGSVPLGVTIQVHGEHKIEWRFDNSDRLEILKREQNTPEPDYAK